MRKFKRLTMTLALLIMAVGGAWAGGTVYNSSVDVHTLQPDDILIEGAAITGITSSYAPKIVGYYMQSEDDEHYSKYNSTRALAGSDAQVTLLAGGVIEYLRTSSSSRYTYTPCDAEYNPLNAWIVTQIEDLGSGSYRVQITAYQYEPEITEWELKPDETGKKWILADMPASNIELQVEYEPTKVTMAANDKTKGTVEVGGESKVEWTADTWAGWNSGQNTEMTKSDGGITMTYTNAADHTYDGRIREIENSHALEFFINEHIDDCTVTFSSDEGNISRIELSMTEEYFENTIPGTTFTYGNPHILPLDGWTFEGKSAVWEGEATKSLTLKSCSTTVSKITFFKGGVPDGVTVNGDGTFTVAKTATVTLKATPAEGYKFLYWEDDQTNTNPVREVTIESGMADMTYKAVFAEITYNVTFVEGTDLNEWTATPNTEVKKDTKVDIKYTGAKKVLGVKAGKKKAAPKLLTLTVGGVTIYYAEGDSWANAISRDENKDSGLFIREGNRVHHSNYGQLVDSNTEAVLPEAIINANESYRFIK